MFCPKCGKQISDMSKFCMSCGCNIDEYGIVDSSLKENEQAGINQDNMSGQTFEKVSYGDSISEDTVRISRLEAEKKRREEAAQNAINRYQREESIGKIMKKKQRRAMVPVFIFVLLIVLVVIGGYSYKNGYTVKDIAGIAKAKFVQILNINRPQGVVIAYSEALKCFDYEAMDKCVEGGSNPNHDKMELSDEYVDTFIDMVKELNEEIEYEILDTKIDGNRAEVKVRYEYKDAKKIIEEVFNRYFSVALSNILSGDKQSEEEFDALLLQLLADVRKEIKPGNATKSVVFGCTKIDKKWYISDVPDEFLEVVFCNIFSASALDSEELLKDNEISNNSSSIIDEIEKYDLHNVKMGEKVELATINMTVIDCEETNTISGSFEDKYEASEGTKYVVYTVQLENIGKEEFAFDADGIPLIDNRERSYYIDDETWLLVDNGIAYRTLSPNIPEIGVLVYKVPEDASEYCIYVRKGETNDCYAFGG